MLLHLLQTDSLQIKRGHISTHVQKWSLKKKQKKIAWSNFNLLGQAIPEDNTQSTVLNTFQETSKNISICGVLQLLLNYIMSAAPFINEH